MTKRLVIGLALCFALGCKHTESQLSSTQDDDFNVPQDSNIALGLKFHEKLDGYLLEDGSKSDSYIEVDVIIPDIDAWETDPDHRARIEGVYVVTMPGSSEPETYTIEKGYLNILTKRPTAEGRFLEYQFIANLGEKTVRYSGRKFVHDDQGLDLPDDASTVFGFATFGRGDSKKTIQGDYHLDWRSPKVLLKWIASFDTINAPNIKDKAFVLKKFLKVVGIEIKDEYLKIIK